MSAEQHRDYILPFLFLKHEPPSGASPPSSQISSYMIKITIKTPTLRKGRGCSFNDLVALKRKSGIGEDVQMCLKESTSHIAIGLEIVGAAEDFLQT